MAPDPIDVAVVGAGPAGLAAAGAAARAGARVLLLDAATQFGGQYWRHAEEHTDTTDPSRWHHGWRTYTALAGTVREAIAAGQIAYVPGTQVWSVHATGWGYQINTAAVPEAHHGYNPAPPAAQRRARTLILCPGAYDRQVPVPGWTLPGVMAAGGVQAFIKTQGTAPGQRVFLGGTGPFLLSAAASVLQAGAQVHGIAEAAALRGWIPRGITGLAVPSKLSEGAGYTALLARHRVPYRTRTAITAIHGTDRVKAVTTHALDARGYLRPGTARRIEGIDVVGLGWGFTPQSELLLQLEARTRVDVDGSLVGVVDGDQQGSMSGLFLAGEITGVAGASGAVAEGRIAGHAAARQARGTVGSRSLRDRWIRRAHRAFATAMHHAHPLPRHWQQTLSADTIVCRCEEVPWSRIRSAGAELAATEPRGLKGTTRLGMGWCQGRICALAAVCARGEQVPPTAKGGPGDVATDAAAAETSARTVNHAALRATARRPVALPITFATLADPSPDAPTEPDGGSDVQPSTTKE